MELYTLNRGFLKQKTIDEFDSAIWADRYYGDGDFEIVVPASSFMMTNLSKGVLMMCEGSDIPMILETREIKDGKLTVKGITLVQWLNNRIFRIKADHAFTQYGLGNYKAGQLLCDMVRWMVISGSTYLNGTVPMGVSSVDRSRFDIPGLVIGQEDMSGSLIQAQLPFGPLYDALKQVATAFEVGMKIKLDSANASGYQISFNTYRGTDRSTGQTSNPIIQFSPEMDSFTNITDLESISDYKNLLLMFASNAPETYMTLDAGRATTVPDTTDGFDLRVAQLFSDFITSGYTTTQIQGYLNDEAVKTIPSMKVVSIVDGEVVPNEQAKYGQNYFLGDIIDVKGNTGVLQKARITEYILAQDDAGERKYPGLTMID